ncbi:DDE superfamily endonuclease [Paraburkholderia sp. BL23I1N1]|uniref:IS630 family transposase n=1 Tax=Paraburkholderia sp. BL23I1N1 TaxID=1938802 RepID=UPI000FED455A|nr:IS630 family transposase [Paraburkholderia sp. BL23I1N1]RKE26166.1 DDE superfamily endonuclease [Paraburkholderia sp. BL23I1N1]
MVLSSELRTQILRHYHVEKWRPGTIARQLHIHRDTVQRVLAQAGLPKIGAPPRPSQIDAYLPFIQQTLLRFPTLTANRLYAMVYERGYRGSPRHFRHLISLYRPRSITEAFQDVRPRFDAFGWMLAVLQKKVAVQELKYQTDDLPDLEVLLNRLYVGKLSDRNKALAIIAWRRGLTGRTICGFLGISSSTYNVYKRTFTEGGSQALFSRKSPPRKSENETLKAMIFRVLHEPPSNYDINRTTWTMHLLRKVLGENGNAACPEVIRAITRAAGYRWRKARIVLTSADPDYSEKLDHIRSILANLKSDEAFFSIDEYGPFVIKMYSGCRLSSPGEQPVVPQWQKSRGSLIVTAALELSSNQITHFYSDSKNTDEMIRMMNVLVVKYSDRRKIYLSWDAASWHIAKRLNENIKEHNASVTTSGRVVVETAPLPAGAQFLNVIESVFSGMSRAIIQNSDYPSLDDAKRAIDRYFDERNYQFQKHPRRAGRKIWGKERSLATFSDSNNCKDPRYR